LFVPLACALWCSSLCYSSFFFYCSCDHRDLHSFPTRRSSDLARRSPCRCRSTKLSKTRKWLIGGGVLVAATVAAGGGIDGRRDEDRKSTRLNSSHVKISYAVFCLKKKKNKKQQT